MVHNDPSSSQNDPPPDPPKPSDSTSSPQASIQSIWQELKRRHVVRVALVYAVVGWMVMQVAGLTFEGFAIPIWAFRFVMLMVILGFPVALVIAWAFELTPQGIKTTKNAREEQGAAPASKKQECKRNWMAFAFAAAQATHQGALRTERPPDA